MDIGDLIAVLAVVGVLLLILLIWILDRKKRKGRGKVTTSAFGAVEGIFHPETENRSVANEIQGELSPKTVVLDQED